MSLTRTKRNNPCQICEDTSGKCRQSKEDSTYWQCMTYVDAKKGEIVGGFKCIGQIKNGLWAAFKPDNSTEWTEQQRTDWKLQNQRRQQQKAKVDDERRRRSLSVAERDKGYRQMLDELTLHPDDRADLVRRGFTAAQIELSGFRSIGRYQQLQGQYSELLPGINRSSRIVIREEGYLCPIRNQDGFIVACQVRLRTLPSTETNRYRWLSGGGQTLHLFPDGSKPDGELPLAVFKPEGKPEGIALVEGVGAKPFLVSQKLNLFTIGAAGGQWFSSPELVKQALQSGTKETNSKSLLIFPDAGDIVNRHVMTRWQKVVELVESLGYEVKVAWWNQVSKGDRDIDELKDFSTIRYISPCEFFEMGQPSATTQGFGSSDDTPNRKCKTQRVESSPAIDSNIPEWQNSGFEKWRKWRQLTGASQVNQQYIDVELPKDNSILAIKSGTGTGKTTLLKKWVSEWRNTEANPNYLCPGYRNSLLRQLAELLGIQHIHESDIQIMSRELGSGIAFCIQSLIKMAAMQEADYSDKIVILDEVMSTLRDLLIGKTVRNRTKVIEGFKRLIHEARIVIIMDATLADWGVEIIKKFAPNKQVVVIENTYKGDKGCLNFLLGTMTEEVDKIKKNDRSPYFQLALEAIRPLICSDSQIFLEAFDRLLAAMGKKVMRVDSKTVGNSEVKEFLKDSNACVLSYEPQSLLYSPTAESGLDISTKGYFSHHFGFFFGVQSVDAIIQMMGRLRDPNCEKYVWVKERVNVTENPTAKTVNDLILSDISTTLASEKTLEIVIEKLQHLSNQAKGLEFNTAIQINETANFEKVNLRACSREAFVEAGYEVVDRMLEGNPKLTEQEKEIKEEIKVETSELIHKAEQISVDGEDDWKELETLKMSEKLEDRWKLENAFLRKRLPGIEKTEAWTPEFIKLTKFDDRDFISHAEMHWLLQNPDVAKMQATKKLCDLSQQEKIFLPDYRSRWSKINAMRQIGIEKFLSEGALWHENSPELKELVKRASKNEQALGVKLTNEKGRNIKYLGKLLGKLGIKLKASSRKRTDGQRRSYQIDPESLNNLPRLTTLNCITSKWGNKEAVLTELEIAQKSALNLLAEKQPQIETEHGVVGVPLVANYVYKNESNGTVKFEEKASGIEGNLGCSNVAISALELSEVEQLAEALSFCDSIEVFKSVIEDESQEDVVDAIALAPSIPLRSLLRGFYEAIYGQMEYLWGNKSSSGFAFA